MKEFDVMMNKVAEKRFKMGLRGDVEKQWHLPIRWGGIGIPKAEDVMAPGYLGNVFATFPYVQELVEIESVSEMKGAEEAWERLVDILEEEEGSLNEECEEHLDNLKLKVEEETLDKVMESMEEIPEVCPKDQNVQHFSILWFTGKGQGSGWERKKKRRKVKPRMTVGSAVSSSERCW